MAKNTRNPRIIIVGAGFGGIGMAIKLQQAGFTHLRIFERGSGVGGAWWFNTYPGIAVDVPADLYSYSFEPKFDWTHFYARGPEIQRYIEHCTDKYKIRPFIQFNTEIKKAVFNHEKREWVITTTDGKEYCCDYFISAVGALVEPQMPNILGIEKFQGKLLHSAQWDNTYDFANKNIAIIGTGASGIQIIPELAKVTKRLNIFQRSAPWVVPRFNFKRSRFFQALFKYLPSTQKIMRFLIWVQYEYVFTPPLLNKKSRKTKWLKKIIEFISRRHRTRTITEAKLLRKVTPDYEIGCKRILVSNSYYPALCRENVELITDHIERITENSVVTTSGSTYAVDAVVCATGFDLTDKPWFEGVVGLNGVSQKDYFKTVGGPEAYYGIAISGFPNSFMITGPNVGAGSMSLLFAIERGIEYIVKALRFLRKHDLSYIDIKKDVMDAFNKKLHSEMVPSTVWMSGGCSSPYKTEDGKLHAIWPGSAREYAKALSKFVPQSYILY